MDNFIIAFNAVMPLLVYLLMGQLLLNMHLMDGAAFQKLNNSIFRILLPLNLMYNVYKADITEGFRFDVLIYTLIYSIGIFFLYAFLIVRFEKDNAKRGVMLQGSFRTNFILFGLPIAMVLLAGRDIGMTTILIAVIVPLNNVLSVVALSIFTDHQLNYKELLLSILKNPMFIGTMLGVVIKLFSIQLPAFVVTSLNGISGSVTPIALMVMGGTFNFEAIRDSFKQLSFTLFLRLILSPIIGLGIAVLLGYRNENLIPILILSSGPTAVSSYTMAQSMGGDADLASQIVVFGTGASLLTMMFWITVINSMALI